MAKAPVTLYTVTESAFICPLFNVRFDIPCKIFSIFIQDAHFNIGFLIVTSNFDVSLLKLLDE